mmetsp:Transcript_11840/g.20318  ORF Transcript_11840/g.20318 Transcript_11840/m.20318 type:complete len:222 (+) Transcript_11840:156-821(+)
MASMVIKPASSVLLQKIKTGVSKLLTTPCVKTSYSILVYSRRLAWNLLLTESTTKITARASSNVESSNNLCEGCPGKSTNSIPALLRVSVAPPALGSKLGATRFISSLHPTGTNRFLYGSILVTTPFLGILPSLSLLKRDVLPGAGKLDRDEGPVIKTLCLDRGSDGLPDFLLNCTNIYISARMKRIVLMIKDIVSWNATGDDHGGKRMPNELCRCVRAVM